MKTKILSIVSVVVLLATLFTFSASAATDVIDNFESVQSNVLKSFVVIQARPGLAATNKVSLDSTTAPKISGVTNNKSVRVDFDISAGEEWSQFKLPMENPQMLNASVLGKNDAVFSVYLKARVTMPVNVGLVVKDERWIYKVLVTPEWKRYDIKLKDFKNAQGRGDNVTISQLVKSGAYNEAYTSEYTFLISSSSKYTSGKTEYKTPMKSTFWIDEVSITGTEIKDEKSGYKRDKVAAASATTTTKKPVAGATTTKPPQQQQQQQGQNTVTTTVPGNKVDTGATTTTVEGETDVTTTVVDGAEVTTTTTENAAVNATTTKPADKGEAKNSATPIIIGAIVIVVLAAGGAALYFLKIKKK